VPAAQIHATTIAWNGNAALICGASGSGKSSLALHLMALGCDLIADDQTKIVSENGHLIARCPGPIKGQIEARGFGILTSMSKDSANIACVIDLDNEETKRLPAKMARTFCGIDVRVFHKTEMSVLPFAILQYLKGLETFET
jgi:HPr kinase/phosphorylase